MLHDPLHGERLVRERHVHDGGGVSFGGGEVDQPALTQEVQRRPSAIVYSSTFSLSRPHRESPRAPPCRFHIEMSRVRHDGAVLHQLHVFAAYHAGIARDGHEDVAHAGGLADGHHAIALDHGLERVRGVDPGYDVSARTAGAPGDAAAAHPVAADDVVARLGAAGWSTASSASRSSTARYRIDCRACSPYRRRSPTSSAYFSAPSIAIARSN